MKKVELLAPAGSYEALMAAIQNGADAVYLGGQAFSARAYASNFDGETLEKAIDYAHIRGVKVYVTINTLIKDAEVVELIKYVSDLYCIGVDAVIVQDLGVVRILRRIFPDLEIHCSTQMTLHNSAGIQLLKEMGVGRVVVARELSVKDIKTIHENTGMELEVFVHGALCYAYSGQCLMSSIIGGRSGNRGRCAQPCRKQYEMISLHNKEGKEKKRPSFYLSTRDLNTLQNIGEIIESGAASFKIEGRMKKPQYVASIVRAYRRAIDDYLNKKQQLLHTVVIKEVTQMFNRKFTEGYILGSPPQKMLNAEKPNNRGLAIGKVDAYDDRKKRVRIKLTEGIRQGDGIEVWGSDSIGGTVNKMYLHNKLIHEAKAGETVEIQIEGKIKKDDRVYKTLDLQLSKDLEKTYSNDIENKKVSIWGELKVQLAEPLKLYIWDDEGNTVYKESREVAEKAEKVPLTEEKIIENLSKLGNTPFQLQEMKVEVEGSIAIPISVINKIRRESIEDLMTIRKNKHKRSHDSVNYSLDHIPTLVENSKKPTEDARLPKLTVQVDTLEQLQYVLQEKVDRIYYGNLQNFQKAIELCKANNVEIFFRSPSIIKDEENKILQTKLKTYKFDGILAGELGIIDFGRNTLQLPIIADTTLNIMNSSTITFLEERGLKGISLSNELDLKGIREIRASKDLEVEALVYGKLAIMTTETCPLTSGDQCQDYCDHCKSRPFYYHWGLKDDKKAVFPFAKDDWGRSIIINNYPVYMIDKIKSFTEIGVTSLRLIFTNENPQDIAEVIRTCRQSLLDKEKSMIKELGISNFTRGHYYRGVE
ncbi:peptidase U32 [Clostridium aceticum]|uniref:Peptidase U32 n=1 Tax=Clostridium aceticum TaxID=84022 RepID=A0A0D8IDV0_9CLOT|nr:U32 family peptidase [Clostridium aceticum]AKL94512.1 peptidase U32 [Clostridium aceticum]KJF28279.1 peptidase U32 [Clostridium aceticum]